MTVLSAVLEHAERSPESVCFRHVSRESGVTVRTYADVAASAARAAAFYASNGVGRNDVVVLLGTHSIDLYGAWLGCMWIGAIPTILAEPSVRVDKQIYSSRLARLLDRTNAPLIALDGRYQDRVDVIGENRTVVTLADVTRGNGAAPPLVAARDNDMALLQHSSGTTGLQKGVVLTHAALKAHARSFSSLGRFTDRDIFASWLPLYHDLGFIGAFLVPMQVGASVVWLSPFEWVTEPEMLLRAIHEHRATVTSMPNFALAFVAARTTAPPQTYDLSCLRIVFNCAEVVTAEAVDAFCERLAPQGLARDAVHSMYAMAENVLGVSSTSSDAPPRRRIVERRTWDVAHRSVLAMSGPSITHLSSGRPFDGVRVRIADDEGNYASACSAGRILVHSPFLFAGYFRDEGRALFDDTGFYDTGDIGYLDEDGHLYVTGRRKDIVIVAGRNVYPSDIEQVVGELTGVHPGRAVCFGVRIEEAGTEGLVVVVESDQPEAEWPHVARGIREAVSTHLDLDLVDVRVVERNRLHKSTSGKLSRSANRESYETGAFGRLAPALDVVLPKNDVERQLCAIWEDVLRLPAVGTNDKFVSLGGSSLSAGIIASRIAQTFRVRLPLRAILGATVAELSASFTGRGTSVSTPALVPIPADVPVPATPCQLRRIHGQEADRRKRTQYVRTDILFEGPLDGAVLERALVEVMRRHDSLRMRVALPPVGRFPHGTRVLVVDPPPSTPVIDALPAADTSTIPDARLVLDRLEGEVMLPLTKGPIARGLLLPVGPHRHVLRLLIHHVFFDGRSTAVLMNELGTLYGAFASGRPSPLPERTVGFRDLAAWEAEWRARGDELEQHRAFWRELYRDSPPVVPPRGSEVPAGEHFELVVLDADHAEKVRALARRNGVTMFGVLLAALNAQLAVGVTQAHVTVVHANRDREEVADMIGCFGDYLPVRTNLGDATSFEAVIARTQAALEASLDHAALSLDEIRQVAGLPDEKPFMGTLINYKECVAQPFAAGELTASTLPGASTNIARVTAELAIGSTPVPGLYITVTHHGGGLRLLFRCNQGHWAREQFDDFVRRYTGMLISDR